MMEIRLDVLTQDPEAIALVHRYWAASETGVFLEQVSALVPFRGITRAAAMAVQMREWCQAYDVNQPCKHCGQPTEITARAQAKKRPQRPAWSCKRCRSRQARAAAQQRARHDAELAARLASYQAQAKHLRVSYASLKDDVALLLMALDAAIPSRLIGDSFSAHDCPALSPCSVSNYLHRLHAAGVLIDRPDRAPHGTYFLRDEALWYKPTQRVYALVPDTALESTRAALDQVATRTWSDGHAIAALWLDYAVGDVMRYFLTQCERYGQALLPQAQAHIRQAVRGALHTYSVAQLWAMGWNVTRDAATLASHPHCNRGKAAASLPSLLERHLEQAACQPFTVKGWHRPPYQPAGTLGSLFKARFNVDEHTPGAMVIARFAGFGRSRKPAQAREPS